MQDNKLVVKGKSIEGVYLKSLNKIPDERGSIYHMMRNDDSNFNGFGEIYFSTVYPGAIKAWHYHTEMELNYSVIKGNIKLVLYDDRENSPTRGILMEVFMGDKNYLLVKVPKMVWNGFKGIGTEEAIVANCATMPHSPDEIIREDPCTNFIPYDWSLKNG